MKKQEESGQLSNDSKTIITVLLLIFAYPVGLILMWVWMTWPKWLKIVISLPVALLAVILTLVVVAGIVATVAVGSQAGRVQKMVEDKVTKYEQVKLDNCKIRCESQLSLITRAADKKLFDMEKCVTVCVKE